MVRLTKTLLATLITLSIAGLAHADGLFARTNAEQVAQGDSFQLVLSGNAGTLNSAPDLTPLDTDFSVLGTSQSRQTQIINGARSDTVQWTVTLSPKSLGKLTVPAVSAGGASSAPVQITVLDPADMPVVTVPGAPEIIVTLKDGNHYVQQEIPLTVTITSGPNVQSAELVLPQSPDFTLAQTGQDTTRRTNTNQGPVTVTERTFMLRPQRDGAVTVTPIALKAVLADPNARSPFGNSPFDNMFSNSPFRSGRNDPFASMFNRGREVIVRAAPVTLDILPDPSGQAGWFLPAKDVQLSASWEPETPDFRAGEAVTRKIQLLALGASDVQLPDLAIQDGESVKFYLDSTNARTANTVNGTAALREFTYSVVPSYGGEVTLPAVSLQWFNTQTETTETATLAAESITVEGAPKPQASVIPTVTSDASARATGQRAQLWDWTLVSIFAIALLGSAALLFRKLKPSTRLFDLKQERRDALARVDRAVEARSLQKLHAAASEWLFYAATQSKMSPQKVIASEAALTNGWAHLESHLFGKIADKDDDSVFRQFSAALHKYDRELNLSQRRKPAVPSLLNLYPQSGAGAARTM